MTKNDVQGPDTTEKILQAATQLFAENNYEAVSIKAIAAAAHVNSALISYHFGGKRQLYEAVLKAQIDLFHNSILRLRSSKLPGLQRIRQLMDEQAKIHLQNNSSMRVIYRELLSPTEVSERKFGAAIYLFYDDVAELFDQAKAEGSIRADVESYAASFPLFSILAFYLMTYQYNPHERRMKGANDFERVRGTYMTYLRTLLTGKEKLEP